jgi:hypothetical protein
MQEGCTFLLEDSDVPIDWILLTPPNMEEGQVDETTTKPKRLRAKKDNTALKGAGIALAGKWIVCQYCGNTNEKALVPAALIKGVAFDTFPCALAWVRDNAKDELTATVLSEGLCKLYEQPPGVAAPAPSTAGLLQFGGKQTSDTWLPNSELWAQLTQAKGVTCEGLPSSKSRSKKATAGGSVVTLEVGMYVIPLKGAPKKVEAVDGVAKKAGELTAIEAVRKVNKWAKANDQYEVRHYDTERYSVTACNCAAPDAAHINNTATQLVGSNVYGPAIALLTRKLSIKV